MIAHQTYKKHEHNAILRLNNSYTRVIYFVFCFRIHSDQDICRKNHFERCKLLLIIQTD